MSELDEIRRRKIEELQKQNSSQSSQEQKLAKQIDQLEAIVKPLFTREALTRYGTIKTAFPERAVQVLLVLGKAAQAGQVKQVDDDLLKKLLTQLTPKQRETRIRGI
jgi:programmed cell death protein 5